MGYYEGDRAAVVLCVPQLSPYVGSLAAHLENEQVILAECRRLAGLWPLVRATQHQTFHGRRSRLIR